MTDQDRCNKFTPHPTHSRFGLKDCPGVPMTSREELREERVTTGRLEGDLRSQTRAVREALAERDVVRAQLDTAREDAYRDIARQIDILAADPGILRDWLTTCDPQPISFGELFHALAEKLRRHTPPPSSVPSRRAQEEPTAANLAEHLSTHQWYSKPEFPLLHEPSAHREHIYNSDCAICRGDLSRIAAVALAYVQTRP